MHPALSANAIADVAETIRPYIRRTPVVAADLADFGLPPADRIAVDGFLDGYLLDRPLSARQALEPLAQTFGFDATMSSGALRFEGRGGAVSSPGAARAGVAASRIRISGRSFLVIV